MLGIGLGEIVVILIIALIAVDFEKLPEMVRAAAKVIDQFKKASYELKGMVRDIDLEGMAIKKDDVRTDKEEGGGQG